jgi:hypothetical protein
MKCKHYTVLAVCAAAAAVMVSSTALAGPKKTYFTILENPVSSSMERMFTEGTKMFIFGAESTYEEVATDPRLTGPKVINFDAVFDLPAMTGRMWGRSHKEHADGTWDGYWTGTRTAFTDPDGTPHVRSTIISLAEGSGAFEGLVVRWDITAVDAEPGTPMAGSGYIVEAKGGPDERPLDWHATRTEEFVIHTGIFLPSGPLGAIGTFDILRETGVGTHFGRFANDGFGLMDLETGIISGAGCLTTANKDEVFWVVTGVANLVTSTAELSLHFVGGTGRFDWAVGEASYSVAPVWEGPGPVFQADYSYSATGSIRY